MWPIEREIIVERKKWWDIEEFDQLVEDIGIRLMFSANNHHTLW